MKASFIVEIIFYSAILKSCDNPVLKHVKLPFLDIYLTIANRKIFKVLPVKIFLYFFVIVYVT